MDDEHTELPIEQLSTEPSAGRRTGCPFHDVRAMLRDVGLRPTRQRLALGWLLFAKGGRHLTAEMLHEDALKARFPVSLATVYNTLNQFTEAGLLREVAVDGHRAKIPSMPVHFATGNRGGPLEAPMRTPGLGEHTAQILAELGIDPTKTPG